MKLLPKLVSKGLGSGELFELESVISGPGAESIVVGELCRRRSSICGDGGEYRLLTSITSGISGKMSVASIPAPSASIDVASAQNNDSRNMVISAQALVYGRATAIALRRRPGRGRSWCDVTSADRYRQLVSDEVALAELKLEKLAAEAVSNGRSSREIIAEMNK